MERTTISDLIVAQGSEKAMVRGVIIDIKKGSGLIQRCLSCVGRIRNGLCPLCGKDPDTFWDLRLKGVVDDGTGAITFIVEKELLEKLLGRSMEDYIAICKHYPDTSPVRDELINILLARPIELSGPAHRDDYGIIMAVKEASLVITPANASSAEATLPPREAGGPEDASPSGTTHPSGLSSPAPSSAALSPDMFGEPLPGSPHVGGSPASSNKAVKKVSDNSSKEAGKLDDSDEEHEVVCPKCGTTKIRLSVPPVVDSAYCEDCDLAFSTKSPEEPGTQKVRCPGCGVPVTMPATWTGKDPDEALCNACHEKKEKPAVLHTKNLVLYTIQDRPWKEGVLLNIWDYIHSHDTDNALWSDITRMTQKGEHDYQFEVRDISSGITYFLDCSQIRQAKEDSDTRMYDVTFPVHGEITVRVTAAPDMDNDEIIALAVQVAIEEEPRTLWEVEDNMLPESCIIMEVE